MKYRITFHGRQLGALGVTSVFTVEVEAENEVAARAKLYDTHEHIAVLAVATKEDVSA